MGEMSREREWLRSFQERLDADSEYAGRKLAQARPVYYAIMDHRDQPVPDGCGDYTMIGIDDGLYSPADWLEIHWDDPDLPTDRYEGLKASGDDAIIRYAGDLGDDGEDVRLVECVRQE